MSRPGMRATHWLRCGNPIQQMGFGLAVAVLIDATVIRSILVPASMKLLGGRNWYLPRWLNWLPNVTVEGPHLREAGERAGRTAEPAVGASAGAGVRVRVRVR